MLQSDFRVRTQPESQVDSGSSGPYSRNPGGSQERRTTPSGPDSASMYSRNESGGYLGYQGSHHPQSQPSVGQQQQGSSLGTSSTYGNNTEERGTTGLHRHRMSLLHPPPQAVEYVIQQQIPRPDRPSPQHQQSQQQQRSGGGTMYDSGAGGMMKMVSIGESPPCKKLRLGDAKSDLHSPLRIDTERGRSGPAYNPEVEAISPTLPSDNIKDDVSSDNWKSTKDELLHKLGQVDREIARTENEIVKLKKKEVELEELATQPRRETEEKAVASDSVIRSLPQSLYAENRKKAMEAHQILDKLGPRVELPLYNQPSDTAVYQENKQKFATFKLKLQNYFRLKVKEKNRREEYLTATYTQLSAEWSQRLEKIENSAKRRNRDAKNRETFEKIFPELRKQREDKERFSRVGSRIKSDADMEEIMDGLQEQELENKKMRSYAVIPPILLDEVARKRRFTNRNGLIDEPMQEYKDKQLINLWTEQEKEIFKEKYLQHPKNFGIIKSYLERKSVADCVQYYYMSKKANNYRQLLRKSRARTRSSRNQQTNNSGGGAVSSSSLVHGGLQLPGGKGEANGVTTRLQKEQKNDHPNGAGECANQGSLENPLETNSIDPEVPDGNFEETDEVNPEAEIPINPQLPQTEYLCTTKKKRKEELNEINTSDEENEELNGDKGIPHNCVVCKTRLDSYLQSRPLVRSQAQQYGLTEDDIHPGLDRVCTSCRCKGVRRRFKPNHCPIPTCPARRARIKRLRPFPPKWADMSEETKEAICSKYQIPPNVTKCCTACFNRINRRLMPNASLDTPDDPGSDTTWWSEEEIDSMKKALTEFGTDWRQLSDRISSKSDLQCRNFYFNFRKKYGLDGLVQEFRKSKGVDGPPILTDEEESGSTTSSCDEGVSIQPEVGRNSREKKEEYDTSATVSAEEMELDKPSVQPVSIEKMKTLPNNPNLEAPLQLTVRATPEGLIELVPASPSHILIHPMPAVTLGHPTQPSVYQHVQAQQQLQQAAPYHLLPRDSPSKAYQLHPGHHHHPPLNSHQAEQLLQQQQHHHHHSHGPHSGMRVPTSPEATETHEPMTVKDLMLATIERQLRKNPVPNQQTNHSQNMHSSGGPPPQSLSPTLQSILKSQERGHLQPPVVISSAQSMGNANQHPHSSPHFQPHPVYYSNKTDMRTGPPTPQQHMMIRENVPVVHIQQQHAGVQQQPPPPPPQRDEYETLDLSMKKRTPSPQVSGQRPPSSGGLPPPAHQPMDYGTRQEVYYPKYPMSSRVRQSQPPPPQMGGMKPNKVLPPPPLLTKPSAVSPHASLKDGSITHGTPLQMSHQPHQMPSKYEGLLKPMKEGSITHGTPLDKVRGKEQSSSPYMYDRSPDNYKRMSPASSYSFHGAHPQQFYNQKSPSGHRSPPLTTTHASNYSAEQHNSSRQIIINDFYTSQQMQQPHSSHLQNQSQQSPRMDMTKRGPPQPQSQVPQSGHHGHPVYILPPRNEHPSYRQSPTPPQHHPQQRQGVIHRTNPNRPVMKPEAGRYQQQHDAFASLVDIAAAQPSLPVPKDDPRPRLGLPRVDVAREGLGKSMVEMERNRLSMPHPQQSQIQRGPTHPGSLMQNLHDASRNRKEAEARYAREGQDATLTAASLIDAIITHQINQPSVHDRQSPIPSSRTGDRLFASFQRCVQPSGVGHLSQQSHLSPNRAPQLQMDQRMERPQQQQQQHPSEDMRMDEGHVIEQHRNPQGSSLGHSNPAGAVTSGGGLQKGTGPSHPGPPQQHQYITSAHAKSQEDVGPYISWKLRRALQHEKEQQQQQQQQISDERSIIRVVQVDQQQQQQQHSRPLSAPSKESNFSYSGETSTELTLTDHRDRGEAGQHPNKHKPREGISPLDYVKNRIMEVMRTENKEDKSGNGEEGGMVPGGPDTSGHPPGHATLLPQPPTASSCSVVSSTNSAGPGASSLSVSPTNPPPIDPSAHMTHSENHRDSGRGGGGKEDKVRSGTGTDSPIPMIIDESGGGDKDDGSDRRSTKSPVADSGPSNPHPNYEPLTDEEGA